MSKAKIFLVGEGKDNLITLEETGYVTENRMQELLADYPDLLPGDQIDPEAPRRWLLVTRELGVPGGESESDRWSLDHLFLDQDGVPTFVECKRATDTRIRREVVAQMLDYAANGVAYWNMERLRQAAAETADRRGTSLDVEIARLLDDAAADVEAYWDQVEANLHNRRVRLVFVTDDTPRELRRLVEFLNDEMTNTEVLAVEVKQFQRENATSQTALVPRLVNPKPPPPPPPGGRMTLKELLRKFSPELREWFETLSQLAEAHGYDVYCGKTSFSVKASMPGYQGLTTFAYGVPPNEFQFFFMTAWLRDPKRSQPLRKKLLDYGVFREAGQWTLKATVAAENLALMNDVLAFIFGQVDGFVRSRQE
jgi:hypothetical protein